MTSSKSINMKIAIIGGGFTGLSAGYYLLKKGHQVIIFEKEQSLGGLASSIKLKKCSWPIEKYFHHVFTNDYSVKKLIVNLGETKKLFFLRPKTSIYKDGAMYQVDSPISLIRTNLLPLACKARTAMATAFLKITNDWKYLEKHTAQEYLPALYGQRAYDALWKPLLTGKFHQASESISMAWFWARIKKRTTKLGYFQGGFQGLVDALANSIETGGGQIIRGKEIKDISNIPGLKTFDRILLTVPMPSLLKTFKKLPGNYKDKLDKMKMYGALNLVIKSKHPLLADGTYWLNINEEGFPFVAIVEHTNFINKKNYDNSHIIYIGGYYPQDHPYLKASKETIIREFAPFIKRINNKFDPNWLLDSSLNSDLYAQPIVTKNYSRSIPDIKSPIKNTFIANMQMVYPWDRGINYAIELGEKVANAISNS